MPEHGVDLHAFVDRELALADHRAVLTHLASCVVCRYEVQVITQVKARVQRSSAQAAPTTLRLRVREQVAVLTMLPRD